ncbi:unnamed protein product, partial [Ectocarpus sp. 4 AP-2014]
QQHLQQRLPYVGLGRLNAKPCGGQPRPWVRENTSYGTWQKKHLPTGGRFRSPSRIAGRCGAGTLLLTATSTQSESVSMPTGMEPEQNRHPVSCANDKNASLQNYTREAHLSVTKQNSESFQQLSFFDKKYGYS